LVVFSAFATLPGSSQTVAPGNRTYSLPPVEAHEFNGNVLDLPQVPSAPAEPLPASTGAPGHKLIAPGPETGTASAEDGAAAPAGLAMPGALQNFSGLWYNETCTGGQCGNGYPPKVTGDVGPSYYIQGVQSAYGIFSKTGTLLASFTENSLFSGVGGLCATSSRNYPDVLYDRVNDHWILANLAFASGPVGPYYECIAASKTNDPVAGGWWLYAVRIDLSPVPANTLPEYPNFGLWNNGCLYMGANAYLGNDTSFGGVIYGSFSLAALYSGAAVTPGFGYLHDLDTIDMEPVTALGSTAASLPPAGRQEFFINHSAPAYYWWIRTFTPGAHCAGGGTLGTPVPANDPVYGVTNNTAAVPQPVTAIYLDTAADQPPCSGCSAGCLCGTTSDRLIPRSYYRKVGTAESLWMTHNVNNRPVNQQWAQVSVTGGTAHGVPVQQQIWNPDSVNRWEASIAADNAGNAALGYNVSNTSVYPGIRITGRLATDPLNTLPQGETVVAAGGGYQPNAYWGYHGMMSVDVTDDCTFWYTNEYYDTQAHGTAGNWQTRIASFKYPSCVPVQPALAVTKTHAGNFTSGMPENYTITVSNTGLATTGTVQVVDTLPAPLVGTAMTGTGWTCVAVTLTCTRSDSLGSGLSYPAITLTVTSPCVSGTQNVTNSVKASGGGDPLPATADDPTTILPCIGTTITSNLNPSTYGQVVTFTATLAASGPPVPTGTYTFTNNGVNITGCVALAISGTLPYQSQCTTNALTAGSHTVSAFYSGDSNYSPTSASLTQVVNKAELIFAADPESMTYGGPFPTLGFSVTGLVVPDPNPPSYTGAPAVNTTATACSKVNGGSGGGPDYPITITQGTLAAANYSFLFVNNTLVVTPDSLAVDADNKSMVYGGPMPPLTYTIAPGEFVCGDTQATATSGAPNLSTTATAISPPGAYPIVIAQGTLTATPADYGFLLVNGVLTIGQAGGSGIGYVSGPNPVYAQEAVTLTATVSPPASCTGCAQPTGSVTFYDSNGTNPHSASLFGGVATLTTTTLIVGVHNLYAIYNGDANYLPVTSSIHTQTVVKEPTTTTLTSSVNPSNAGQAVTFAATVTRSCVASCPAGPTGTVSFKDYGTVLATLALPASGVVTYTTATLGGGTHGITALYNSDANFLQSVSPTVVQVVGLMPTTTTLTSSLNPANVNQPITFTATVTSASGTPTGTVVVKDYGTVLATLTLNGSGAASFTTSTLAGDVGHDFTATYAGDLTHASSVSSDLSQVVNRLAATITGFSCSPNPSSSGANVTCAGTASLAAVTIYFTSGPTGGCGDPSCTTALQSALSSGTGGFSGSFPLTATGTYGVSATFMGNATYRSAVATEDQVVQ
jgi:hypothetical protein